VEIALRRITRRRSPIPAAFWRCLLHAQPSLDGLATSPQALRNLPLGEAHGPQAVGFGMLGVPGCLARQLDLLAAGLASITDG
jgi:hypothetical protein